MQQDRPKRPVYEITGARRGLTEDIGRRQLRYGISMGIRTVCFVLAVITHGWLRAVFIVGALVLPYLSVVYANSGREPGSAGPVGYQPDGSAAIDPVRRQLDGTGTRPDERPAAPPPADQPDTDRRHAS